MHAVLTRLRVATVLNKHGVGAVVGQAVKTASAAFLCAGLQVVSPDLGTEADLLGAMAAFDSTTWMSKWERQRTVHKAEVETGVAPCCTPVEAWVIA